MKCVCFLETKEGGAAALVLQLLSTQVGEEEIRAIAVKELQRDGFTRKKDEWQVAKWDVID